MKGCAGSINFLRMGENWFSGSLRADKGYNSSCGGFEMPQWNFWGYSLMVI